MRHRRQLFANAAMAASRLVAVRWGAALVMQEGERPHPRVPDRRGVCLEDAADYDAFGEHVKVVLAPFTGRTARRR
jgi:hypothetical protein